MSMPDDATLAQINAAEPEKSTWVTANAGSGKTRVLTDRVARLLLRGSDPQKILCLTFTKAAAAEMQNRLFSRLGDWAMMPDDDLRAELQKLGEQGMSVEDRQLVRARTLFARALETPGGLKIQTIHSFCERLLRQFPLEASISPQFEVIEDRQAAQIQSEILEEIADGAEHPLFDDVARHLTGDDPLALISEILNNQDSFGGLDEKALRAELGMRDDLSPQAAVDALFALASPDRYADLAGILENFGGVADKKAATALRMLKAPNEEMLAALEAAFLTKTGIRVGNFPVKKVKTNAPDAENFLRAISEVLLGIRIARNAAQAYEKTCALHRFGEVFLARYTLRKQALGRLDFTDLIDKARFLLRQGDTAQWVLYRLDGGIDHILVDEAQDTSPEQWQVIEALSAEFFSEDGARERSRTVFVVGDEKQSIYSFQGADPAAFDEMRNRYAQSLDEVAEGLEQCELLYSFRSAKPILDLVDETCRQVTGQGIGEGVLHKAHDAEKPGRVDLWNFIEKADEADDPPWYLPLDMPLPDDPVEILAKKIAEEIAHVIGSDMILPGHKDKRVIHAGDFLILVQSRSTLFHAIIRELKAAGVPVAGADRLLILQELAVRDLLSLLRFLLTPGDDLSLAEFLRSPMGGLDEAALFSLAHERKGTLYDALRTQDGQWPALVEMLKDLRNQTDYLRPFEILERILVRHNGRTALTARLGPECEDGIDALLAQALDYERVEAPSLTGFLDWLTAGDAEIKRQMDAGANQVRVMTVHGAKGLEAPVVILPQTNKRKPATPPKILETEGGHAVWTLAKDLNPPPIAAAYDESQRRQMEERNRLLYVAMTRAESWLIICGAGDRGNQPEESWYGLAEAALSNLGAIETETGKSLISPNWVAKTGQVTVEQVRPEDAQDQPLGRASSPAARAAPLNPSKLGGAHVLFDAAETGLSEDMAMLRGSRIHLLLEKLPLRESGSWHEAATEMLSTGAEPANTTEIAELFAEAEKTLSAPDLKHIFHPDALVEVDITAHLPELGKRMRGVVDRLVITETEILAIDFKSNQVVPEKVEDVPEALLRQMGAYAAALTQIWPDRKIRTALLWTNTANLMELPHEAVKAALARAQMVDAGPDTA